MKAALMANAFIENYDVIQKKIEAYDFIIAVDNGLEHLHKMKLQPSLIIGDFDSVDPILLKKYNHIKTSKYPIEKDETDLELAILAALEHGASKITGFCCLGKRVDHEIANLILLSKYSEILCLENESETIFVKKSSFSLPVKKGQKISFFPFLSEVENMTTKGFKWNIQNKTLSERYVSISNVCLESIVELSFKSGNLLIVLEHV